MQTLTPSFLETFVRPFKEFIFPPACLSCGDPLSESTSKVCATCWSSIRCVSTSDDLYLDTKEKLESSVAIAGLVSFCYFDPEGAVQKLVHELKYNGMTSIGVEFGRKLGELLATTMDQLRLDGFVPVPLHKTKLRERGYNQSDYVCRGISKQTGIEVFPNLLRRVRYTPSQTALDIEERKLNVHEAFEVDASYQSNLKGKTFVIVDDVITTGATIVECAKVLRNHGVERVITCSVALAP